MHGDPVIEVFIGGQLHDLLQDDAWIEGGLGLLVEAVLQGAGGEVLPGPEGLPREGELKPFLTPEKYELSL